MITLMRTYVKRVLADCTVDTCWKGQECKEHQNPYRKFHFFLLSSKFSKTVDVVLILNFLYFPL